jgi:tetratricopeptide (TPR) repeat protein
VLGDRERAVRIYRGWFDSDPSCEAALAGLMRLHATDLHPEQLLDVFADVEEPRRGLLVERYLERLSASGHWSALVAVLGRLASEEPDPGLRAARRVAAGTLWRDELGRPEQALRAFESALEDHLAADGEGLSEGAILAFQAIDDLLTARADWLALERTYRHMIDRIPLGAAGTRFLATLWENLGWLYRRLDDSEAAERAFATASHLQLVAGGDEIVERSVFTARADDTEKILS